MGLVIQQKGVSRFSIFGYYDYTTLVGKILRRLNMKITAVTPLVLGTPWRNLTFVKVDTDEGIYVLGEIRLNNRTNTLLGYLSEATPRYAVGHDPFYTELLTSPRMINDC